MLTFYFINISTSFFFSTFLSCSFLSFTSVILPYFVFPTVLLPLRSLTLSSFLPSFIPWFTSSWAGGREPPSSQPPAQLSSPGHWTRRQPCRGWGRSCRWRSLRLRTPCLLLLGQSGTAVGGEGRENYQFSFTVLSPENNKVS